MAESFIIDAQPRTIVGKKVNQLRRQGMVPITVYGPKSKPVSLQVPYRPLQLALLKAGGTNLIDLKVDGQSTPVIAREVQRNILRNDIMHVDFFAVDMDAKINIDVPIHFINESPAVASRIGILLTGPTVLTISTLPSHLINQIEIDLAKLVAIGDSVHVRDLDLNALLELGKRLVLAVEGQHRRKRATTFEIFGQHFVGAVAIPGQQRRLRIRERGPADHRQGREADAERGELRHEPAARLRRDGGRGVE